MKKERFYKGIILLLVLINAATLSWLWLGGDDKRRGPGAVEYLTEQLNLSDEQQQQIRQFRNEHEASASALRKEGKQLHDDFFGALGTADSATVERMANAIADHQKKMELLTFYNFKKIREVCTPEQQKRFDELIKETMRKMAPPPPGQLEPKRDTN